MRSAVRTALRSTQCSVQRSALRAALRAALLAVVAAPAIALAQPTATPSDRGSERDDVRAGARASDRLVTAFRTRTPMVLDGLDRELAWRGAPVIDAFREMQPNEDGTPAFATEARVVYDDSHLYLHVRAFDPHPDSIVGLLSRRDQRTPSDYIAIMIDSYHDKRTGYAFMVNPTGVQRDWYIYNDGVEDLTWDAVWDAKTAVDSLGWSAEFRIPLNQLRFPDQPEHTFGVLVLREVQRRGERYSWPLLRRSRVGLVSQFGELGGFAGLPRSRRLEIRPYLVERNVTRLRGNGPLRDASRAQEHAAGLDVKYGLGANFTIDATVNPDFGQVEADPAVLNLSAFEQFFQERRPFFIEGVGIFRYDIDCNDGQCTGLFYPRRIGRAPQLAGLHGDNATPQFSPILGAAKMTGRLPSGLSIGVLDAVTARTNGAEGRTAEPQTNYMVARAMQEFRGGNSVVGVMATGVQRALDDWSTPYLRRSAWSGGLDARHRFAGNRFEVSGFLAASHVRGDTAAISRTQRSLVHAYMRPDGALTVDDTRTTLNGTAGELSLRKVGGGRTRFALGYQRKSAGFEINDVGFLTRSDIQSQYAWGQLFSLQPTTRFRRFGVNVNQWASWNTAGLPLNHGGNVNGNAELANFWNVYAGIGVENLLPAFDDRAARGGPAVRRNASVFGWSGLDTDGRRPIVPGVSLNWGLGDGGRSWNVSAGPRVQFRGSSRVQGSVSVNSGRAVRDWQWVGNVGAAGAEGTAYTFATLDQHTHSLTARFDVTASPTLSLQVYAQPFITTGRFTNWRELADPRATDYDARFTPYDGDPGGFNVKEFRSNVVARWEYRPGSTLFFVWQQGRSQSGVDAGSFDLSRDVGNLFGSAPNNTFLVKASYWFGR
jgi:hypothetical protein